MSSFNQNNDKSIIRNGDNFDVLVKFPFLSLLLIGIGAFLIRIVYFQDDLIFFSDNLSYFKYAIDVSITNELPTNIILPNNGWPLILSVFFKFFDSNNFLEFMNLQSYLTIIFSTITIIPLYFLAKKFVSTPFALITTILFVFEPRIIQNSLIGVTDPLFILLNVTSLALIFQKNKYIICGSFVAVSLASIVRAEGLFLIPALLIIFLIRFKISKKTILQGSIFLLISFLILIPFGIQRMENSGNDFLIGRILVSSSSFSEETQNDPNQMVSKIGESIFLFLGFLGRLMIPYLIIFVPIGCIILIKRKNIQKYLLIIPGFFLILPSLYAYTVPALDVRYLFPILPILCIIGTYTCIKIFERNRFKKISIAFIIFSIMIGSIIFLDFKSEVNNNQIEFLELANIINKNTGTVLYVNSPIFSYLDLANILELDKFPVTSIHYDNNSTRYVVFNDFEVEEFFLNMKKNGITHIVFDEEIENPVILKKIFYNDAKFNNVSQIFDSEEFGYDYQIRIFKID